MHKLIAVGAALAGLLACEVEDPCVEYVDYMCDCHPEQDCDTLRATYSAPDPETQEQCIIDLDAQQSEDVQNGVCQVGEDTDS